MQIYLFPYLMLLRHLELSHAHVAPHAEHDAEAKACQKRDRVACAQTWQLRADVLIYTK